MNKKNTFMMRAIELSIKSANSKGGPFGCVIVKNEKIIAEGSNQVTTNNDPTLKKANFDPYNCVKP